MIEFSAATDKGLIRKINQDYYIATDFPVPFFVVCDGMGGHVSGDVASRSAAESIAKYISMHHSFDTDDNKAKSLLTTAIEYANKIVYARSCSVSDFKGMGTTCDICFIDFDMCYISHVGDSRVYLYRENILTQLTRDHTLVEELLENGSITENEIETHPGRHLITRAVGTEENIISDFIPLPLQDGDVILMCSDGLTNMLSDTAIKKILLPDGDVKTTANRLVEKANENGGVDNITALVIRYTKNKEER